MPVHLIKGGYANTYLIEDNSSVVAVDVGTAAAAVKIHRYLHSQAKPLSSLSMATATHLHIDHVGGLSKLASLFPQIRVCFLTAVRDYFQRRKKIALFRTVNWVRDLVPIIAAEDNHLRNTAASVMSDKIAIPLPFLRRHLSFRCAPECVLNEGPIPYLPHWSLIKTPGHTPESICLYNSNEGILLSGDTILNMTGSGELNRFCSDCGQIKQSFQKLVPLKINTLYPGHGKPLHGLDGLGNIVHWE